VFQTTGAVEGQARSRLFKADRGVWGGLDKPRGSAARGIDHL